MGIYVITGATSGIGAKTAEILRERGHEVVNIDLNGGDINANLATKEGRAGAIAELHERFPEGIDAMICNAGVSGGKVPISLIISLNYFGATEMARGVFDLLEKKGGSCVVTSSNSIAKGAARMDVAGMAVRTLPGAMALRRTPREPQSGLMRRTQRARAYLVDA